MVTSVPNSIDVSTAEDLVDELRARIAGHDIPPGARLKEHDLASEFGVSRSRVRDAFAVLESRGLIERSPNRGAVVARLDHAQLSSLYDVREVLEGLCVRLATENSDPSSWQDLVELFGERMESYVDSADFDSFVAGYEAFRLRTIQAAANPILTDMLAGIHDRTRVLIRRIIILPGRAEIGLGEHRAVLAAMRAGDAASAERLRRRNMRSARHFLERYESFLL
ncbi:MAG: GntR family transcriptional regulator [Acidimicrobiia bacterium]|nr:GntR family transcriptional regulator [Acidimicrobiia bacterium]